MLRKVSKIELIILCFVLVLSIVIGIVFFEKINIVDIKILTAIRTYFNLEIIKDIMYLITLLLSPIPMIIIFALVCLVCKDKSVALHIFINTAIAAVLGILLKEIFQRERPFDFFLIDESGYSFPSAHSIIGVTFYGTMIYSSMKHINNKTLKIVSGIFLWTVMVLTPISRLYLGVHHFTDVLIGSLIGVIIIRTSIFIVDIIEKKQDVSMLDAPKKKNKQNY